MSVPPPTATKTIKLVVPPQYHDLGYQDYTATLSLSETPSTLKRAGTQNGLLDGMTLLFRGRRITPEEEQVSFEELMKKFPDKSLDGLLELARLVGISLDEEVLVFHCVVHPDAVAKLSAAQKERATQETRSPTNTTTSASNRSPQLLPGQSTFASAISTGIHSNPASISQLPHTDPSATQPINNLPSTSEQRLDVPPPNIPPQGQQPHSIPIQGHHTQTQNTQAAIQQNLTQTTAQQPIRPNIHVLPIQYQAILINGLPYLAQINRPQIRLSSDTVIPVTTHEGHTALIVSPQGVLSLAQQGYRVEIRVFSRQADGQVAGGVVPAQAGVVAGAGVGGLGVAGAGARGQPAERRFGLTDFVSLFRRRLGQQLWLMCKLAFMVGVFSSNNASWRRIFVLCLAAAGIFFWQTGELERWARRFRRPILPPRGLTHAPLLNQNPNMTPNQNPNANTHPTLNATPNTATTNPNTVTSPTEGPITAAPAGGRVQEGPMAAVTAGLRLAEQVLFVFVASLWPNAVAVEGGEGVPEEMIGEDEEQPDDGMVVR